MRLSSLSMVVVVIFTNLFIWWQVNRPINPAESGYPFVSLSFNPYQNGQDPFGEHFPTSESIESDIKAVKDKTRQVRVYTARGALDVVPELARKYNLNVIAGAWLDARPESNEQEVEAVIKIAGRNRNVSRVIIGNETQLHKLVPRDELVSYLRKARERLRTPVSTAEPWDMWINDPALVQEVDYIAIHVLPYWVNVPIEQAVDYVLEKYRAVKEIFPYKMVVIAETGWPSDGPKRGGAEPSRENQARFVREFIRKAQKENINYNLIEAFDQPWKAVTEGHAGAYWGIMNADRQEKFPLTGPVHEEPNWRLWALSSAVIGALVMALYFWRRQSLEIEGQLFSAIIIQTAASAATELAREASGQYFMASDIAFWTVMVSAQALLAVIFLTDAIEIADVVGNKPLKRRFQPVSRLKDEEYPFVSIHVACCKEPPEMVIATIESLSKLDYPRFEVIVVDNNTPDEALWRPVEKRCSELGERFRFYSLGKWPGFKAGALNFALKETNPEAKVIGVVDADYVVEPNWLSAAVPYFQDALVGVVQAPQEHRAWEGSLFERMENDEYSGFFRIGMVQRNEDNAIIQHGTMTLICRETIESLHGWAEWCITEDAELGLRILNAGKRTVYLDHVFGRGLVPDTYEAYAKQRFRWAYGGMRIMRHYWRELLGTRGNLDFRQRYQFVKGWLPWIGDGLHMLFTALALLWSAKLMIYPLYTDFPAAIFIYPAIALVLLRLLGTAFTYEERVKIGSTRTLLAMIAGGSLTHVIAKAVVQGLFFRSGKPFYRTPKMENAAPFIRSLITAREEITLAVLLWGAAFGVLVIHGTSNSDAVLWMVALMLQSIPYIAAILAAIIGGVSGRMKGAVPQLRAATNQV